MSATLTQGTVASSLDSAHATSHVSGGSDAIAGATTSVSGLMSAADKVKLNALQSGTSTLVAGTVTVSSANISATSRIVVSVKTSGGTAGARLAVPSGSRSNGTPGSFVINAVDTSGALVNTDTSTVDWIAAG